MMMMMKRKNDFFFPLLFEWKENHKQFDKLNEKLHESFL